MSADYYQVDAMLPGVGDYLLIGGSFQYRRFHLTAGEFGSNPVQVFLAAGLPRLDQSAGQVEAHFHQLRVEVPGTLGRLQLGLS